MSIPYTQPTIANVRVGSGTFISYPFLTDGDTTTKVYNMACSQRASDYAANQVALDDTMSSASAAGVIALPFAADSSAYFVGDTGHAPSDGGMLEFTRTFANIPQSSRELVGTQAYNFPGWSATYNQKQLITITAASYTSPSNIVTLTTAVDHDMSAGGIIQLNMDYTLTGSTFVHYAQGRFRVVADISATQLSVDLGRVFGSQKTMTLNNAEMVDATYDNRPAASHVSTTMEEITYILPGVTSGVTTIADISVPPVFNVYNILAGVSTDTLKDGPYPTMPSKSDYLDMIDDKAQIVIESTLEKWRGNILKQNIKTIRAL